MAINSKSTKDQILKAYNDLEKEKKALESKLSASEKELSKAQTEAEKAKAFAENLKNQTNSSHNEKTTVKVVHEIPKLNSVSGIITTLDSIEEGLSIAISEVSGKLTVQSDALADLNEEINEKNEQLKTLYGVEAKNGTLDKLIDDFEISQKTHREESQKRRLDFETDWNEKRKIWEKEQRKHNKSIQERNETTAKNQEREYKEYKYDLELARNLEKDNYLQKKKKLQQELDDLKEVKQIEWKEREDIVKKREDEFEQYKKDFEEFPTKLDKEIKKAEAEAKAIIEKEAKVKADLFAKEIEARNKMFELKIQSLNQIIDGQNTQIQTLSKQLEAAIRQAQELAIKAIEGSSNLDKFNAVKEIANELAKNQQKNK